MSEFTLIVGNKNYSSWSLRGYLPLARCGVPFDEVVIPLDRPETAGLLATHTPAARVPVLRHRDLVVWDSLAIAEYLAELFPEAGLWPQGERARAVARAVTAEMHAGFAALRAHLPMDLRGSHPGRGHDAPGVRGDIERVTAIWRECRARFASGGDFLFGAFTIADAAYAPVATRFRTYDVALDGVGSAYVEAIYSHADFRRWYEAALREPWVIEQ